MLSSPGAQRSNELRRSRGDTFGVHRVPSLTAVEATPQATPGAAGKPNERPDDVAPFSDTFWPCSRRERAGSQSLARLDSKGLLARKALDEMKFFTFSWGFPSLQDTLPSVDCQEHPHDLLAV